MEAQRRRGGLAQLEEHLLCKQGVTGSSPVTSTRQDRIEVLEDQVFRSDLERGRKLHLEN